VRARCFYNNLPIWQVLPSPTLSAFRISCDPELNMSSLPMASLPNYLLTNRKLLALSQDEVAFLLGVTGPSKGSKVSKDESSSREPSLKDVLAYELIYGKSARELFAGVYEQVEEEVAQRAKLLTYRVTENNSPKRQEALSNLISKIIG
jgi:transcriptional regulator with XRE-family HTH domain